MFCPHCLKEVKPYVVMWHGSIAFFPRVLLLQGLNLLGSVLSILNLEGPCIIPQPPFKMEVIMHQPLLQQTTKSSWRTSSHPWFAKAQRQRKFTLICCLLWAEFSVGRVGCRRGAGVTGAAAGSFYNYVSSSNPNLVHFSSIKLILKMWFCACFCPVTAVIQKSIN